MGIVFRVLYNNKDWKARCATPGKDDQCWLCFEDELEITMPKRDSEECTGHCWEQHLCVDYKWGCTPKGRKYGNRARPGVKAFFVFKQSDGRYTLWGKTIVRSVDSKVGEDGYAYVYFNAFKPLPKDKWVKDLKDTDLVEESWRIGRHRFIRQERENALDRLIDGIATPQETKVASVTRHGSSISLNIDISANIYKKLEEIAEEEGREIDEVIRESIAGWLRKR
ncbi:MAG: hypothetical protein WC333_05970 [Dehalococcoidia bacterium]|jgi:hypothetical protein